MVSRRFILLGMVLLLAGSVLVNGCGGKGDGTGSAVQVGADWARVADEGGALFSSPGDVVVVTDVCAGGPGLVAVGYRQDQSHYRSGAVDRDFNSVTLEIWTSPNGRSWSRLGTEAFVDGASPALEKEYSRESFFEPCITSGPAGLVATCGMHIFKSTDGLRWSEVKGVASFDNSSCAMNSASGRATFTYIAEHFVDVIATGNGYIASVASVNTSPGDMGWLPGPSIWTSPDGAVWSLAQLEYIDIFSMNDVNALALGGSGLVAVGGSVDDDYSINRANAGVWNGTADGLSWVRLAGDRTALGGPDEQEMLGVSPAGQGVMAVGIERYSVNGLARTNGVAWASPDGTSWSRAASGDAGMTDAELSCVTDAASGPVAAGRAFFEEIVPNQPLLRFSSAAVWTSPDSLTWTRILLPRTDESSKSSEAAMGIASFSGGLVVVGYEEAKGQPARGAIWTSLSR